MLEPSGIASYGWGRIKQSTIIINAAVPCFSTCRYYWEEILKWTLVKRNFLVVYAQSLSSQTNWGFSETRASNWFYVRPGCCNLLHWDAVTRSQQTHPAPVFALSANCQTFQSYSLKIHWIHNVIVVGNFNALNISWDNLKVSANLSFPSKKSIELTHEYNLAQFIKEPTRQQGNLSNTMDLVLFNHPDIICNFNCIIRNQQSWYIVLFTLKPSCQKKWYDKRKVYIRKWWAY